MKWSVIANDSINDFDDIGNDNNDNTTQEIFIGLKKFDIVFYGEKSTKISVVLHEAVSKSVVKQSVNKNTSILQHVTYKVLIHEGFKKFDIVLLV